ncbi:MFS transporter [Solirubrobacter ginsenosidimutans]|uniref:MFS transporter n=2 Tax=Solirubrobacter ginsenosidimutans TaxID=490573 RepID=A0A9X3SA30_9ACTN|nr:MFS transporter [Solirubrobacter ginsenosidimutans]
MALVVVCLGQLMMVVDMTIVNVALPVIQRDLRFSQADLTWVVGAYLISYGSFLLMAGRLGDLVGRKRVFLSGVTLFTIASALCGVADSQLLLIAARFLQGLGGAISTSVIIALIVTDFPRPDERVKAMGAYMFVVTSGGSLGLLLGGALVQSVDWHWIFYVNLPIGIAVLALGARLIENRPGLGLRGGIDATGSVLVTSAMMVAVYAIVTAADHGWASGHTLGFGGAAVILLAAFAAWESRIENPILPFRILRVRTLIGASVVRSFLVIGMFGTWVLGTLYVEHVLGYGAWDTGLAFLPMTLTVGALSLGTTAKVMARLGPERTVVLGMSFVVAALLLLTHAGEGASYFPELFIPFALMGLGMGTAMLPLLTIAMSGVPEQDAGLGSGIVNVSMQLAGALGIAVLGTLAASRTGSLAADGASNAAALTGGYHLAFELAAGAVVVGIALALTVLRVPARVQARGAGSEVAVEV